MQKTFLFIAAYFLTILSFAQQKNFVYIEADNGQPFYVKINDKVYSSSPSGYIVLSELMENNYDIRIGFPKNAFPEQRFSLVVNKKDQGFQLKNFGEKGWGLFNLKTLAIVMNSNIQKADDEQAKKTDGFSVMLSKVVNDPAILMSTPKPEVTKEEVKSEMKEEVKTVAKEEIKPEIKEEAKTVIKEEVKQDTVIANTVADVHKLFERKLEKVYEASYVFNHNGVNDTINISYPINEKTILIKEDSSIAVVNPSNVKVVDSPSTKKEKPVVKIVNSDCQQFATDQDLDKLRVKLMNEKIIDDRLAAARKYFRTKCFTVKQVRSLTELFPGDEDKYRLFDTAYPFISDTENFPSLEGDLKEEYYKNRFKAMIRK